MEDSKIINAFEKLTLEIKALRSRLNELENKQQQEVNVPKTMLLDKKFLKRSFAVLGHYIIASLIIVLPIYLIVFIIIALLRF
jgi:lipopolysaccharide/colanic/teichoic acid biosynthesis glycosyltransferase